MSGIENVVATYHVPNGTGKTIKVDEGDLVRITDLEGQQPVDFWAFNADDPKELLSCEHTKVLVGRLSPVVGESAYTNPAPTDRHHRRGQFPPVSTTWSAPPATSCASLLGAEGYHANCQDNLDGELKALGLEFNVGRNPGTCSPTVVVHP